MSTAVLAGAALAVAGVALATCARVLLGPLRLVLLDLCGEPHRAEFWTRMAAMSSVAATAMAALLGAAGAPHHPALAAASLLRWTALGSASGLVAVMVVVAAVTLRGTPPPAYGAGRPHSADPPLDSCANTR
jgi:hypothetical protein